MANRSYRKRLLGAAELSLSPSTATTGVWAAQLAANVLTLHKAAAATTSVLNFPVMPCEKGLGYEDGQVAVLKVYYQVTTADLTSAPTAALRKMSTNTATGVVTASTIAGTLTFSGVDTIGKVSGAGAAGSHVAIFTVTTPVSLADNENMVFEVTMNEAATSVLDISGLEISWN